MTNHWNDIANASLVLVFGANPAENHPAVFNHINNARFGSKQAKLVVIDPRQTRTARQCDPSRGDFYVRIRPGTNIAFINGVLNLIFQNASTYDAQAAANMLGWHNGTATSSLSAARTFVDDSGTTVTFNGELAGAVYRQADDTVIGTANLDAGYPKYCDSRIKVNTAGDDYQYANLTTKSYNAATSTKAYKFSNFPVFAADVSDPACVYQKMVNHVKPYDTKTVADICGCTEDELVKVAKILLAHSRFASKDFGAAQATPQDKDYRATTILYAMGQTQHTTGGQNIKGLAQLQTVMGNMGRPGGGINALRGIHNVQGSTDFGNLFDSIPGYSGNPGVAEHYSHYQDALFGNRLESHNGSVQKDYTVPGNLGLQQRGFHNMTSEWFGNGGSSGADVELLYNLWPKGNGSDHISSFRKMAAGTIRACVVWGQNPAVTEPNQSKVRDGLRSLDLLVCTDIFENETAAVDRKPGSATYLIPACSHVEEAGSVTNSGRWLQWRERAAAPKGNSKSDLELLLRLAYAIDKAQGFKHITDHWANTTTGLSGRISGNAYDVLYGKYGWKPDAVPGSFEALEATTEVWRSGKAAPASEKVYGSEVVAENIYIEICRPLNATATSGGTMWIYSGSDAGATAGVGGYNAGASWNGNVMPSVTSAGNTVTWEVKNRAKSRNKAVSGNDTNNALNYPRWGWAWLLNRRVFYNNGEVAADQSDTFVSPGALCCLFTNTNGTVQDYSLVYRKYKGFSDKPSVAHPAGSLPGRFASHTEPYESPRPELVTAWGNNTSKGASLLPAGSAIGTVADGFDLVLTTIRAVEHFQGGPITRNNPWNAEAEPEPWIEINPVDARRYNINDGDLVNVVTARSNSTTDQNGRTRKEGTGAVGDDFAAGFRARVDNSISAYQRVGVGVVAIPWHWGDRGLSQGSRANDLTIDAYEPNVFMPEYKACLCKLVKL